MTLMRLSVLGEDEDVVEVNKHKLVFHVSQDVVHQGLEDGRRIGQPERHDEYSQCPVGMLNAVFHLSPSLILTKW